MQPTILITGATGFLGGALVSKLLCSEHWDEVLLLVRASDAAQAHARVLTTLRRFTVEESHLRRIRHEQVLCADLAACNFADERLRTLRRVVHCAALTSFGSSARIFEINVAATRRLAERLLQVAPLERFVYVSTAMICGARPARIVHEDDSPRAETEHLVDYTASKAQAECTLKTLPALPLVVARPSIVVGHSQLGCQPSGSLFWAFRMVDALGMLPADVNGWIDVVPVDYVARALELLLLKGVLSHQAYHISAGATAASYWPQIAAAFARQPTHYRSVGVEQILARSAHFQRLFGLGNTTLMSRAIRLYGAFAKLNCVFANTRLLAEGCNAPPRFADYLPLCLRSCEHLSIAEQMLIDV